MERYCNNYLVRRYFERLYICWNHARKKGNDESLQYKEIWIGH